MARRKKASKEYEKAIKRMAAVQSIDPNFNLGGELNQASYQNAINDVKTALDAYNTILSTADEKLNTLNEKEKHLGDMNERVLVGVAAMYGKNSSQYEQAGGVRKSERKRPVRQKKAS